jgi:N-acetylneuraminate synthase
MAETGKPVILSTGASTLVEVHAAVDTLRRHGCKEIILLYCVLRYPVADEDVHLRRMQSLQHAFPDIPVGYSDHTQPDPCVSVPAAAVALGAHMIQKHFTLDRALPGDDHEISVDPRGLATLVRHIRLIEKALGDTSFGVQTGEEEARKYARRSIVAACAIPAGTRITHDMLIMKRPGTGIAPSEVKLLIGRVATVDIEPDALIAWTMVK